MYCLAKAWRILRTYRLFWDFGTGNRIHCPEIGRVNVRTPPCDAAVTIMPGNAVEELSLERPVAPEQLTINSTTQSSAVNGPDRGRAMTNKANSATYIPSRAESEEFT